MPRPAGQRELDRRAAAVVRNGKCPECNGSLTSKPSPLRSEEFVCTECPAEFAVMALTGVVVQWVEAVSPPAPLEQELPEEAAYTLQLGTCCDCGHRLQQGPVGTFTQNLQCSACGHKFWVMMVEHVYVARRIEWYWAPLQPLVLTELPAPPKHETFVLDWRIKWSAHAAGVLIALLSAAVIFDTCRSP